MKTYLVKVMVEVSVDAFNANDAQEAVRDYFGEGESCGLEVTDYEVLDLNEL